MGSRSGFNPNQSRADDGKWKKERGQRPASGGLRKPPAGEAAAEQVTAPDLPPSAWRTGETPTSDLYDGYRANRDAALDPTGWGSDRMPAMAITRADRASQGMLETAPLRIRDLMRQQHPEATAVTFQNVGGQLKVTGFATDPAATRPEIHRLTDDEEDLAGDIDMVTGDLAADHTKPSAFDMAGMRVDLAGNWYLPLDGDTGEGPGFVRSSPEGVRIENAQLEYDAQRLENAADTIDRPEKPVSEITSQRELMWFVQNGTDDEVEQVAKSPHARAAVLHNIAMYGPEASQRSAIVNWQVSKSTIRAVYDRTPEGPSVAVRGGVDQFREGPCRHRGSISASRDVREEEGCRGGPGGQGRVTGDIGTEEDPAPHPARTRTCALEDGVHLGSARLPARAHADQLRRARIVREGPVGRGHPEWLRQAARWPLTDDRTPAGYRRRTSSSARPRPSLR